MERLKRIALYGGTFDPVHVGHLAVARNLSELFALEGVLFIPAHVAPHKRHVPVTPPLQRYAMLALATQDEPRFRISTIELDAPERPYTVDTLALFQQTLGRDSRLFFIMGADSWMEITTWREWERVLDSIEHLVVTRPGFELTATHLSGAWQERIVDLRGAQRTRVEQALAENDARASKIYFTDAVLMDVAATEIRRAAHESADRALLSNLVSPEVAEYIRKYRLYKDTHETEPNDARTDLAAQ
ncbi:MAG TPA: nicotinate-nucleotide adenylyltransferase [Pyrinomonadaceae bacterium]|jgi:nicotinate-nucleotide adenylyltransferase|nr:nicotinate-nucleotide adenylyltransferase [Pyrinomonadaceae bacterium]